MKITLTNEQIVSSLQSLQELAKLKVPVRLSWSIGLNIDNVQTALNRYSKIANELVEKYRDPLEPKEKILGIKLTDPMAYGVEVKELLSIEVEVEIRQIKLSDLNSKLEISSGTMSNLTWLFIDDVEEADVQTSR